MSKRNSNNTNRSTTSTRKATGRDPNRVIFDVSDYDGTYESSRKLQKVGFTIRREDTRHGGTSNVTVYRGRGGSRTAMHLTLSEARSLLSFLDRELTPRAR
jgi:hypothetical protein